MGSSDNSAAAGVKDAAPLPDSGRLLDAPLTLAGSAPSWSLSYTPSRNRDSADAAPAPAKIAPGPSGDALEGLALSLWDEGRKEEAISVLERQIAFQKDSHVVEAPPVRRFRTPLKAGLAAVMLLGIGGALWGGLNPSGFDPDAGVDGDAAQLARADVPNPSSAEKDAADSAETGSVGTLTRTSPSQAEGTVGAIRQVADTESAGAAPGEGASAADRGSEVAMANGSGTSTGTDVTPPDDTDTGADPEQFGLDEPPAELPEESEALAAEVDSSLPAARLPKPRPDYSAEEALAMVEPAEPLRAARRVRDAARVRAPEPPRPPEVQAWQPPVVQGPIYGPYPQQGLIIVDPRLAEQRAIAEWYLEQRRRARMQRRAAMEENGFYYEWERDGY